jgi:pimeloyl-ACP methyl ester carboxylesterase
MTNTYVVAKFMSIAVSSVIASRNLKRMQPTHGFRARFAAHMTVRVAVLAIALLSYGCATPRSGHSTAQPDRHTVSVDGHPIALWSRTAAKPQRTILLVHGRTWSALPNFDLQFAPDVIHPPRSILQALADKGYAAYAIDLRGYGSTPRNANGWNTPEQGANDIAAALRFIHQRHPQLEKPVLLGWSMGSLLSHLTAQTYPDALSALILYGYPRDPASTAASPPSPANPPREVNTKERAASDFISPKVTSQLLIDTYVAAALKADPIRADWRELQQYQALSPTKIKTPTLVLVGEHDPLAPMPAQSRLFLGLGHPDKQWVVLAGGDHAAMLEDTHPAFIAAIHTFVTRPQLPQ